MNKPNSNDILNIIIDYPNIMKRICENTNDYKKFNNMPPIDINQIMALTVYTYLRDKYPNNKCMVYITGSALDDNESQKNIKLIFELIMGADKYTIYERERKYMKEPMYVDLQIAKWIKYVSIDDILIVISGDGNNENNELSIYNSIINRCRHHGYTKMLTSKYHCSEKYMPIFDDIIPYINLARNQLISYYEQYFRKTKSLPIVTTTMRPLWEELANNIYNPSEIKIIYKEQNLILDSELIPNIEKVPIQISTIDKEQIIQNKNPIRYLGPNGKLSKKLIN
jgi:hypothetical protein